MTLDNEFSVSKVNCDSNTLLLGMREHCSAKKVLKIPLFSLKLTIFIMKYRWNTWYFLSLSRVFNKDQKHLLLADGSLNFLATFLK